MRFELIDDPDEFTERVWPFVAERLERNIIGTLLLDVRAGRYDEHLLACGFDDQDRVAYVGIRTDGHYLLTSDLKPELASEVVDWWLGFDPEPPGVDGPPEIARAIADAWAERTGGTARLALTESMHVLNEVDDPTHGRAPGSLRVATERDRELLIDWILAFSDEAGLSSQGRERIARGVDVRLVRDAMLLWDDGRPVSLVGVSSAVAGVARIGPVYTPPDLRGRGYAGTAVADASRRLLAGDAERCLLFTDIANPTANKIYADVGYRRVGGWQRYALEPPARR